FGKSKRWGCQRLAEFRETEGGVSRSELVQREREAGLAAVWAELHRAEEAGEPHTGASLGTKFGKSLVWGYARLAEFRRRERGTTQAQLAAEARDAELEAVWAEVRRAEEAGKPHTGATLGKKFGKGRAWGYARLAEFRDWEAGVSGAESVQPERNAQREAVWAEVRRAEEAGKPHTAATLGKKFGKSASWGKQRLAEFRRREGGATQAQLVARARDAELEAVWAELRRARDAGDPHTGRSLAVKFGKNASWGKERLAEFRRREGVGSVPEVSATGRGAPAEGALVVAGRSGAGSELLSADASTAESSGRKRRRLSWPTG
ncbi:hypothetical protein, partial [Saccharopolyspora phatthalungensis]